MGIIHAVPSDDVVVGIPNVPGDPEHEITSGHHVQDDGKNVVRYVNIVLRGPAARYLPQVHPNRGPVQSLDRLPDQEVAPPGPGERHEGNKPEHELWGVHLIGEHEGRHDEEGELGDPRPCGGGQSQDGNQEAGQEEQAQGHGVDGLGIQGLPLEPFSEQVVGKPGGAVAGRTVLGEVVEEPPTGRVYRGDGKVDCQPGSGCSSGRDQKRPDPACPQGKQQDRAKDQERINFSCRAQANEDSSQHQPVPSQEVHGQGQQSDGPHVPVDQPGQDDSRRQGNHGCIPGPTGGHPRGCQHHEDPHGGDQRGVDVEIAEDPGITDALAGNHQGSDTGNQTCQYRVLEGGTWREERKDAVTHAPIPEQLREVGVTRGIELSGRFPAVDAAMVLDEDAGQGRHDREDDEYAFHRKEAGGHDAGGGPGAHRATDQFREVPQQEVASARNDQTRPFRPRRRLDLLHVFELTAGAGRG